MIHRTTAIAALAALLCACASHGEGSALPSSTNALAAAASAAHSPGRAMPPPNVRAACGEATFGASRCFAWMRTDILGARAGAYHGPNLARARAMLSRATFAGYAPADFQSAYALPSTTAGSGQIVGIVDGYGDKTAESDLAVYRKQFGLPPCTTKNGCLKIVNEKGKTSPLPAPDPTGDWEFEESLDLDMVSAICPNCKIVFVEATTNQNADLHAGVTAAVALGAQQVSNSYGSSEYEPSDTAYSYPGKAIVTASAGDSYLDPQQPASLSTVVAVGGTQLKKDHSKRGWSETVWNDSYEQYYLATGSGCSNYVTKPSWQKDKGCPTRANNDIAASADCQYYALIYDTSTDNTKGQPLGWTGACGTSEASPIVAAAYALAGNSKAISKSYAKSIYDAAGTAALNPVTKGYNWFGGPCPSVISYICTAGPGYNGPAGFGTPNGIGAL